MVSEQSQLTMGELFAGIGGFSLGFRRAGFQVKWQVEIEPYCRKVLAKNFPEAERFEDVRTSGAANLCPVDVICGGFPCQDISYAGLGAGIEGERSGLWREYARIISELRPRFAVVENVAALLGRGIGRVLGDLAGLGYDAEWKTVPACMVGSPHCRERVWIVAYPKSNGFQGRLLEDEAQEFISEIPTSQHWSSGLFKDWRQLMAEPEIHRMANGFPERVVELTALGNAVVPQIPEWIAHRIIARAFLPHP